jgi:purine-binding chemotaxis protein CheW
MNPSPHTALAPRPPPGTDAPGAATREYLSFRVGTEEYAIDILRVQEIRSQARPTRIAHAPAAVQGVVDLRGVIVPIVDLRLCLQALSSEGGGDAVTIVLDLGRRVMGVVVDAVSDVLTLGDADIRPSPELGGTTTAAALLGIASVNAGSDARRTLIVLDIQRLLADAGVGL